MLFVYKYYNFKGLSFRKKTITNNKNKTNFKTVVKEIEINSNEWRKISCLETGETYNTYYKYDNYGKVLFIKRYNKEIKSKFKQTYLNNSEKSNVIIIDYNGEKTIKFSLKK